MGKRVALVLAGCGVFDGSEIHEASAALVHLSRGGAEVKIFAPNIEQRDVVNHLKGSPTEEKRNVLVESARLARGNIQDLAELKASEFDAVIFPGCENFTTYLWTRTPTRVQKLGQNSVTWQCLNLRVSENVGRIAGCQVDYVPCQIDHEIAFQMEVIVITFRNEETRASRGNHDLLKISFQNIDSGFGVAKNLCTWAVDGKNCTVNEHVNTTLQAFHSAKKPIGLCCISPVLAAKVFPGCEVTVGQDKNVDGRFPDAETASAIAELGCKHICKNVNESHVDKANKIVTTCAFMCKAPLHEIFDGIGTMVQEVLKLA